MKAAPVIADPNPLIVIKRIPMRYDLVCLSLDCIGPKKTGPKMFKPQTPVNQFPSKTDRRPTGQGINVTQVVRSNENGKLIQKV